MLVLAKSPALYRTRIVNSVVLLLLGIGFAALYHYVGLRAIGPLVGMATFILLMVCLFAGVHLTADSISKEKREGTLGLLFLTPLTPFQIVIGKLIAHGLMGFYAVIITVPLLSLIMIVGGTRLWDIGSIGLAALNILFFSASVGLWASTRHTERKKAGAAGTWTVVFFWWGIPIIVQLLHYFQFPHWTLGLVSLFQVNAMFNSAFAGPRMTVLDSPWLNLLVTHLMAWGFVASATYLLRTRWQDQPAKVSITLRERWRNFSLGNEATRLRLRKNLMDRNPFLWLASRDRLRSLSVWLFTIGFLGFVAWQFRVGASATAGVTFMLLTVCFVHKIMLASASAHQLSIEQEQGTLEMLLSTPLKAETVLKGQIMASFRQFRGPVILWLLAQLAVIAMVIFWEPFGGGDMLAVIALSVYSGIHFLELYAMAWAGMWGAVTVKDAKNATGAAMLRIIALPGLIFGLTTAAAVMANWYWRLGLGVELGTFIVFYFSLCIANALFWIIYFRKRLPLRLREFALKRYTPVEKATLLGKLGSTLGVLFRKSKSSAEPPILGASGRA